VSASAPGGRIRRTISCPTRDFCGRAGATTLCSIRNARRRTSSGYGDTSRRSGTSTISRNGWCGRSAREGGALIEHAAASEAPDDPLWYKDAVIYQVHVRAFFDENDDGIGDFRGLTQKLDYIERLGVTAIWLLPFYPSPMRDDGYDIADYRGINPVYGNARDFRRFVHEAHARGLKVITELVINHTSDQHPWFQAARKA